MWWEKAVCLGADTEIFFTDSERKQKEVIRAYCDRCPVRLECLDDAIRVERGLSSFNVTDTSIRGGLTSKERSKLIFLLQSSEDIAKNKDRSGAPESPVHGLDRLLKG